MVVRWPLARAAAFGLPLSGSLPPPLAPPFSEASSLTPQRLVLARAHGALARGRAAFGVVLFLSWRPRSALTWRRMRAPTVQPSPFAPPQKEAIGSWLWRFSTRWYAAASSPTTLFLARHSLPQPEVASAVSVVVSASLRTPTRRAIPHGHRQSPSWRLWQASASAQTHWHAALPAEHAALRTCSPSWRKLLVCLSAGFGSCAHTLLCAAEPAGAPGSPAPAPPRPRRGDLACRGWGWGVGPF